jgi:hypothetical protein
VREWIPAQPVKRIAESTAIRMNLAFISIKFSVNNKGLSKFND